MDPHRIRIAFEEESKLFGRADLRGLSHGPDVDFAQEIAKPLDDIVHPFVQCEGLRGEKLEDSDRSVDADHRKGECGSQTGALRG